MLYEKAYAQAVGSADEAVEALRRWFPLERSGYGKFSTKACLEHMNVV